MPGEPRPAWRRTRPRRPPCRPPCPRPLNLNTSPLARSTSTGMRSTSPGLTGWRKRQLSTEMNMMPLPSTSTSSDLLIRTPPVWAIASMISTPGITGWPGKVADEEGLVHRHALDADDRAGAAGSPRRGRSAGRAGGAGCAAGFPRSRSRWRRSPHGGGLRHASPSLSFRAAAFESQATSRKNCRTGTRRDAAPALAGRHIAHHAGGCRRAAHQRRSSRGRRAPRDRPCCTPSPSTALPESAAVASDDAVASDHDVVGDLHQVVDLGVLADHGVFEGAAVDAGLRRRCRHCPG